MDNNSFWFETEKVDADNYRSYYFKSPRKVLKLTDPERASEYFAELEKQSKKYYLAGFFSYELGYIFEDKLGYQGKPGFPLAYFCVYDRALSYDHLKGEYLEWPCPSGVRGRPQWGAPTGNIEYRRGGLPRPPLADRQGGESYKITGLRMNVSKPEYSRNIAKIKRHLTAGDIYQANYTIKYKFNFSGSPVGLYDDLKRKQNAAYNVFAKIDGKYIISASPELFFEKKGDMVVVLPMKGTVKRGRTFAEDKENRDFLRNDEKNRAENLTIVDLLRNDLGRISSGGTVLTKSLFDLEKFNSVFQMTSRVEGRIRKGTGIYDFIRAMHPSGSVTGAPKIRCMEILRRLEKEERGLYTGSIGFFAPDGGAKFNVAIRTIILEGRRGEMGVGGGIVIDSKASDEYEECRVKARFLSQPPRPEFNIIETMYYNGRIRNLRLHMQRLRESADYYDYRFDEKAIMAKLDKATRQAKSGAHRVRLLLTENGGVEITTGPLEEWGGDYTIAVSKERTDSADAFLFHKTTNRSFYDERLKKARAEGLYDMLFLNEKDELTEGCITNIYIEINNKLYTPPLSSGLLNGVMRRKLIKEGKVKERVLKAKDLKASDAVYISNAVIGMVKARVVGL